MSSYSWENLGDRDSARKSSPPPHGNIEKIKNEEILTLDIEYKVKTPLATISTTYLPSIIALHIEYHWFKHEMMGVYFIAESQIYKTDMQKFMTVS